jgi:glycosyltransferase involved in cell wall biosynthesis
MLTLVPGISGGSETYARELCRALARSGELSYRAFVPTIAPDAGDGLPGEIVPEHRTSPRTTARLLGLAVTTVRPGSARRRLAGCDVVHYPLTVPLPTVRQPTVVTLHDVQHVDLAPLFSRAQRAWRRRTYDRAAAEAAAVVVVSEFVRERAVATLGLDAARVHVVPAGVDTAAFSPGSEEREPLLLYPARPWPHKNHGRLLEAFALLRARRPELRLVLTGAGSERLAGIPGVDARGSVTTRELVSLYRRAACLVFPSLYEGFGLPPLEAMASGCPVAAARAGALPEVCGEAAVLFDPRDPQAIAAGVEEALERAEELRALGRVHAAAFSWDAAARGHDAVYRTAVESTRA